MHLHSRIKDITILELLVTETMKQSLSVGRSKKLDLYQVHMSVVASNAISISMDNQLTPHISLNLLLPSFGE